MLFERVPTVRYRTVNEKRYLAKLTKYYELDEVAWDIWLLCDGTRDLNNIVEALRQTYDAEVDVIQSACQTFVQQLIDWGLVRWKEEVG